MKCFLALMFFSLSFAVPATTISKEDKGHRIVLSFSINQEAVKLTWTDPDPSKHGYHIFVTKDPDEKYVRVTKNPVPKNEFVLRALKKGLYYFIVRPVAFENPEVFGPPSDPVSVLLPGVEPAGSKSGIRLSFTKKTGQVCRLTWTDPERHEYGYNLYAYFEKEKKWEPVNTLPRKEKTYQIGTDMNGRGYFYVRAILSLEPLTMGAASNQVAVEFHPIQDDWGGGPGVIDLYKAADMRKWPEPYDAGFKGYNIYVSTFPEGPFVLAVNYPLYGLGKDLVLVGFQPGKPYYFTFTNVFRDESESARSKVLKVIGQEPPPRPTPTPRG